MGDEGSAGWMLTRELLIVVGEVGGQASRFFFFFCDAGAEEAVSDSEGFLGPENPGSSRCE